MSAIKARKYRLKSASGKSFFSSRVKPVSYTHLLWEDALALLFGTALVALGIAFYAHAGLLLSLIHI